MSKLGSVSTLYHYHEICLSNLANVWLHLILYFWFLYDNTKYCSQAGNYIWLSAADVQEQEVWDAWSTCTQTPSYCVYQLEFKIYDISQSILLVLHLLSDIFFSILNLYNVMLCHTQEMCVWKDVKLHNCRLLFVQKDWW